MGGAITYEQTPNRFQCFQSSNHEASFRGRERSERSPESITTGRVVRRGPDITAWGYGFRVRRQVGRADLPAPRNDVEVFMTQFSFAAPRNDGIG